jgi:RNA polymerase sigma-70 factor (ECF subfamily)
MRPSPDKALSTHNGPAFVGQLLLPEQITPCLLQYLVTSFEARLAFLSMSTHEDLEDVRDDRMQRTRRRILDRLFRSESAGLRRFLRSRIGRDEEVHDLVQEAFASLAAARPQVLLERPEAYLQRVACNLVVNRHRRAAARNHSAHVEFDEALNVAVPPEQDWALEASDATARYVAVLDTLAARTREIFLMNRVDGLSYEDIADRTGMTVKGVEYHMSRALMQLHQAFYGQ